MTKAEIEQIIENILKKIDSNQPVEDSLIELKSNWIQAIEAANKIAGHANAALGDQILWLIGIDEKKGVVGADRNELADWYPQVQSCFDGAAPILLSDYNIVLD